MLLSMNIMSSESTFACPGEYIVWKGWGAVCRAFQLLAAVLEETRGEVIRKNG